MDKEDEQRELMQQALQGNDGRTGTIFHEIGERDKQIKIEARKKEQQSKLEALLMDAQYKAAYDAAMDAFDMTQSAVYEALIKANHELNHAQQRHNQILDNASSYGDIKVFMDANGNVYTEDDRQLTDDEMLDVDWRENAPSRETYLESREDLQQKQKRFDSVNGHQKRLDSIHSELNNEDNPPSRERLEELKDEALEIHKAIDSEHHKSAELETAKVQPNQLLDLSLTS